jgi:hypothetical protein
MVKVVGTKVVYRLSCIRKSKKDDIITIGRQGELGVIICINEPSDLHGKTFTVRWVDNPLVNSICNCTDVTEYKSVSFQITVLAFESF